jgi:uncharacterized membrane protein
MAARDKAASGDPPPDPRSTTEVLASFVVHVQALLAKEVELFGLELRGIVARKLTAIGLILTGALTATGVLGLSAVTAAIALEDVFSTRWHAWGVVTLAFLLVSVLLLIIAVRLLAGAWTPTSARQQLSATSAWARELAQDLATSGTDEGEPLGGGA